MKLSKTSAHAVLAVAYLASSKDGGVIQARQVADHLNIQTDSALKILQVLAQHKLIDSRLGRSGGYRFTKSPDEVTLLQIVEAIDGPVASEVPAINAADNLAGRLDVLRVVCDHAAQQIRDRLQKTTVSDLLFSDQMQVLNPSR